MAENLILCSFLGICSCYDLKLRKIPGWLLYTGILLGTLYWGILKMAGQVSGLLVMPAGLMQQWQRCTAEIIGACLLTFFLASGLLISRKGNRNTRIPFAPFFLAAVILVWIMEAWIGVPVDK